MHHTYHQIIISHARAHQRLLERFLRNDKRKRLRQLPWLHLHQLQ
jgi:hypothetical protein